MKLVGEEIFENLVSEIHKSEDIHQRYQCMKKALIDLLQQATQDVQLQFPDVYSRLVYVCDTHHISAKLTYQIQTLRKHIHLLLLGKIEITEALYQQDLWALCQWIHTLTHAEIPKVFQELKHLSDVNHSYHHKSKSQNISLIRFIILEINEKYFVGKSEDLREDNYHFHFDKETSLFRETLELAQAGQIIHLIDAEVDQLDIHAELIILEPDYLVDISAIAECCKNYGHHPYQYFINKLQPKESTTPLLLGNIANHFLDVFVHAPADQSITYQETMKDIFKMYPFEISVNAQLDDQEEKQKFNAQSRSQFHNIQNVVRNIFPKHQIDVNQAILEPSFICTQLGVQGRLDFLSVDELQTIVIELKSGTAPFPYNQYDLVADNHKAQLFLYQIVIQKVLQIPFKQIHSYLFYSKYEDPNANLRKVKPYMDSIKEIFNIRNQIVSIERRVIEDVDFLPKIIAHLSPELLANKGQQNQKFLNTYIFPQILEFKSTFSKAQALELSYFYHFYQFVSTEQYIAKCGYTHQHQSLGHAALWLHDIDDKIEAGEILYDLTIIENNTNASTPTIRLRIPTYSIDFLPNFRKGDIVVLYQRDQASDQVSNRQIYRGSIIQIDHQEVTIRFRNSQRNTQFLPENSLYAIEHDFMDATFTSMYKGLYHFLTAKKDRRQLLLHQRPLESQNSVQLNTSVPLEDIRDIVLKAKQAKDYFLLLGPPGTGKTSVALKSMVEEFYSEPTYNILLLSYTNRAVDEICESISQISPEIEYIRIGSEFSTEEKYHHRLLQNVIKDFDKRDQVKDVLMRCRVYVGTVASLSGRSELFKLKKFQVSIIDEASQILEPQILGILSMKHTSNDHAIEKFIMIGDHKQLPAIVLQSKASSQVNHQDLNKIGIYDRRVSLFERLYRYLQKENSHQYWSMLKKQGRMHPEIASFANQAFYNGQLYVVPTIHQQAPLDWKKPQTEPLLQLLSTQRVAFFSSQKVDTDTSFKVNSHEVSIIQTLLKNIWHLYQSHSIAFDPSLSVGIITPYRSQIALIRKAIYELGIPELEQITIDTVERYQGSQRDIILYSFCVNHKNQLQLLSNSFEEDGKIIDRKLNVALTRARKQMFLIGNPYYLSQDPVFYDMLQHYPPCDLRQ